LRGSTEVYKVEVNLNLVGKVLIVGVPGRIIIQEAEDEDQKKGNDDDVYHNFKS
jgi:hypothetical protein